MYDLLLTFCLLIMEDTKADARANADTRASESMDFDTATLQEKFLMMMNDRIGNVEEKMHDIIGMMSDIHASLTTTSIRSDIIVPNSMHTIDAGFVDKMIAALERVPGILVAESWVILHKTTIKLPDQCATVYLRLKKSIIIKKESMKMNERYLKEFNMPYYSQMTWLETCLDNIDYFCLEKGNGMPEVFHKMHT